MCFHYNNENKKALLHIYKKTNLEKVKHIYLKFKIFGTFWRMITPINFILRNVRLPCVIYINVRPMITEMFRDLLKLRLLMI